MEPDVRGLGKAFSLLREVNVQHISTSLALLACEANETIDGANGKQGSPHKHLPQAKPVCGSLSAALQLVARLLSLVKLNAMLLESQQSTDATWASHRPNRHFFTTRPKVLLTV